MVVISFIFELMVVLEIVAASFVMNWWWLEVEALMTEHVTRSMCAMTKPRSSFTWIKQTQVSDLRSETETKMQSGQTKFCSLRGVAMKILFKGFSWLHLRIIEDYLTPFAKKESICLLWMVL